MCPSLAWLDLSLPSLSPLPVMVQHPPLVTPSLPPVSQDMEPLLRVTALPLQGMLPLPPALDMLLLLLAIKPPLVTNRGIQELSRILSVL